MTVNGETWRAGGDIVVSADGQAVDSVDRLRDIIGEKKPGDSVRLGLYRGTKHLTVSVKLGRQPS